MAFQIWSFRYKEYTTLIQSHGDELEPIIVPKILSAVRCRIPICGSFLRYKGRRTPLNSVKHPPTAEHSDVLKKDDLKPGDNISTDQYACRVKARLHCTKGKEDPSKMFCGGSLFVGHATSMVKVYNQVSLGTSDTIRAKQMYEAQENEIGVTVKHYHGDNGVYTSKAFQEDLENKHQSMSHSGFGAHDQNGVAERAVQKVVNSARAMMLHQALLWPTCLHETSSICTRTCCLSLEPCS